jgi:predicted PurR-regulated permease PerM
VKDANGTTGRTARNPVEWMRWVPVTVLAVLVLVAIVIGGNVILVPLLSSVALAYLLAPVVAWFERRGWLRPAAVLLTMTSAVLALALILIFVVPSFWNQASKSYAQARVLLNADRVQTALNRVETLSPELHQFLITQYESYKNGGGLARFGAMVAGWLQRGLFRLVDLTTSILDLLLIPFFVFYFLSDYAAMRQRVDRLIPPRFRGVTSALLGEINQVISSYVRSQLLIGVVMGALYSVGFLALRIPLAFTIGMLSGLLNFVPYLGTLTGLVLSLGFAALDGAGPGRLVGVLVVFVLVQSVEAYYLTPRFLGSQLNLHPMWVLAGLMIGGNLFGLLGIILAVPVIAIAKVVLGFLETLYQQSEFYRTPAVNLLTGQGHRIELSDATPLADSLPTSDRPHRTIITTAELRSRTRDAQSTDEG